jgi:3D (Asp-Asp-Asp) domain-containing protein
MKKTNVTSSILVITGLFATCFAWASASLNPTIYYIKTIDPNQGCKSKKTIYSVEGKALTNVCSEDYKSCVIEGTCAILNQKPNLNYEDDSAGSSAAPAIDFEVINYIETKNGRPLFAKVDEKKCPWGLGVSAICLDPYFTVAADLNFHKAGEVIFVDKLKGVKLPTGEVHAGFLIVRDKGGAIKGANRFDFYTGLLSYRDEKNPFTPVGLNAKTNKFEYRKATKEEAEQFRKERNFPSIPR